MGNSQEKEDALRIASQLANKVSQAIATLHQQNPAFISEKFRQRDWQAETFRSGFVQKVTEILVRTPVPQQLQNCHQTVLKQVFDAAFFGTREYRELLIALNHITMAIASSNQTEGSASASFTTSEPLENAERAEQTESFALLLLDAENLQLSAQQEVQIADLCDFSLRVKIAFANWRRLNKQFDAELHRRDYDLIHVPAGDDMADGKMIAVGSSLKEHYPDVQEVLVCSSDKVMINLCTKLRQQGLVAHRIQKRTDGTLCFIHGRTEQVTQILESTFPALEVCVAKIREVVLTEQKKQSSAWVKLSTISQRFKTSTGFLITSVVNTHIPGKRARDLFLSHPDLFVVHQPTEQSELYISLFQSPEAQLHSHQTESDTLIQENVIPKNVENSTKTSDSLNAPETQASEQPAPKNQKELEAAIVSIVKTIKPDTPSGFICAGKVASQFKNLYQLPITEAIQRLKINNRYIKFLQSCSQLVVEQQENKWLVKLR